ncbi:unnamed protein product [Brassicogethes aeneus]|uniref:Uncharacterized protein n=1 Tax=Brassicogethes aeneus TaxID=1431903 RepID=A0A9P0FDA8_BRAAE|nr:unnamed protein product [Brassicogethes aeneus]
MTLKQFLIIFVSINACFSRRIDFLNHLEENIIVSITGRDDFLLENNGFFKSIEVPKGNRTIYAKYAYCKINDCDEYVTKAQFKIGYIAKNLDLKYIDLRSGYNFYMEVKSSSEDCETSKTCREMLTVCPKSTMVLADKNLVACKNTKESYIKFLECDTAVTSDMNVVGNTQTCVNVQYYTITFGKKQI